MVANRLLANYDLTNDQVADLLEFDMNRDDTKEHIEELTKFCLGLSESPKPSTVG